VNRVQHASPLRGANPARGATAVRLSVDRPQAVRAELVDALGRRLAVLHDGLASGTVDLAVDASALAPGVYAVRAQGEGWAEAVRLTVVR